MGGEPVPNVDRADHPAREIPGSDRLVRFGYDIVLLDSPLALSVSDPSLLAPLVDGVLLLVLGTGAVGERDLIRAKEPLEMAGGNLFEIVMNRFDDKSHGPGFHPYESYYATDEP